MNKDSEEEEKEEKEEEEEEEGIVDDVIRICLNCVYTAIIAVSSPGQHINSRTIIIITHSSLPSSPLHLLNGSISRKHYSLFTTHLVVS